MKLVLIPGLDGTGELFAPLLSAMPQVACQVLSYPPDLEMDYAAHEAHVRARLPAEDFILLAESFSGPVGVSIAASPPANLRGLILCASFASNPLPLFGPLSRLIAAFPAMKIPPALFAPFLYGRHGSRELRRLHAQAMARVSAATLRARVAAILRVDYSHLLRRIEFPMLYLQAVRDRLVPRSALTRIQRIRPDIEVAEIDGPHFLLQTRPTSCAERIVQFIQP